MTSCPFCTNPEVKAHTIASTKDAFAFPTNIPITPGHTLVCPKRCVPTIEELSTDELCSLIELYRTIKDALGAAFAAEGFNAAFNVGEAGGQSVPHFHLHVVPRTPGDNGITEYEPRSFLYRPGSRAESPAEELDEVARTVRAYL